MDYTGFWNCAYKIQRLLVCVPDNPYALSTTEDNIMGHGFRPVTLHIHRSLQYARTHSDRPTTDNLTPNKVPLKLPPNRTIVP